MTSFNSCTSKKNESLIFLNRSHLDLPPERPLRGAALLPRGDPHPPPAPHDVDAAARARGDGVRTEQRPPDGAVALDLQPVVDAVGVRVRFGGGSGAGGDGRARTLFNAVALHDKGRKHVCQAAESSFEAEAL